MGRLLIEKGRGLVLTRDHHGTVCRFMPPLNVGNAGLKKKPKKGFRFFEPLLSGRV
jgi:hypothetical protein